MRCAARIKRVKELEFRRPDGQTISLPIPPKLNQKFLRRAKFSEYSIFSLASSREIAELEVGTFKFGGDIVGFLIPGQALLSAEHPLNTDPFYGTYSLIAALTVCEDSMLGDYSLAGKDAAQATSGLSIFQDGTFYAVIWHAKIGIQTAEVFARFFVSLAKVGLYPKEYSRSALPHASSRTQTNYNRTINLTANAKWPQHVETILARLFPFAENEFLRFFYLYQVIETLMAQDFTERLSTIKSRFLAEESISITQLKDFLKDFNSIVKEEPRIKNALQPPCGSSNTVAKEILDKLGESHSDLDFGARIYLIRNIVFHDYQRIHHLKQEIAQLEDFLMSYLLETKFSKPPQK